MAPHSDGQASFSAPHLTRIDPYGGRKVGLTGATVVHPFVHLFNLKQLYGADSLDESPCLNWPNVTGSHVAGDPGRSLKVATRVRIPRGARCDVARHRRQLFQDIVDTCAPLQGIRW
jgi:hypothetical protein